MTPTTRPPRAPTRERTRELQHEREIRANGRTETDGRAEATRNRLPAVSPPLTSGGSSTPREGPKTAHVSRTAASDRVGNADSTHDSNDDNATAAAAPAPPPRTHRSRCVAVAQRSKKEKNRSRAGQSLSYRSDGRPAARHRAGRRVQRAHRSRAFRRLQALVPVLAQALAQVPALAQALARVQHRPAPN